MAGRIPIAVFLMLALAVSESARTATPGLRLHVTGEGPVTIVLEAGLGDTLSVWKDVQPELGRCTRTVSYTRAGYPGSGRAAGTRDARAVVDELRAALQARGIAPPYVLVGHSLGGLYVQYFARQHPAEVRGLLLLDPTHPDQLERMQTESPGAYRLVKMASMLMPPVVKREFRDSTAAGGQVRQSPAAADLPVRVLSSTRAGPGETDSFRELAARLQRETAAMYPRAAHEFVEGSGHYVQRDKPELVIAAALELAGRDASCAQSSKSLLPRVSRTNSRPMTAVAAATMTGYHRPL